MLGVAYLNQEENMREVPKSTLVTMIGNIDLLDSNYYKELGNKDLFIDSGDAGFSLTVAGEKAVDTYLRDMRDSNKPAVAVPKVGARKKVAANRDKVSSEGNGTMPTVKASAKASDVTEVIMEWDKSPLWSDYQNIDMDKMERLDQIILALHAWHVAKGDEQAVGRTLLSSFMAGAFGVKYDPKRLHDRTMKPDAKPFITFRARRGYVIRVAGTQRVTEIIQGGKGTPK